MFDIIYNYIGNYLINSNLGLDNVNAWNLDLTYILTATSIVLIFILIILFIRWFFRLFSGFFTY